MRFLRILILIMICAAPAVNGRCQSVISAEEPDSISAEEITRSEVSDTLRGKLTLDPNLELQQLHLPDEQIAKQKGWWKQLRMANFNLADTTIRYPGFIQFCVNAYNWADRFFNTYDPRYVQPTGKRWKFIIKNENWTDAYAMHLQRRTPVNMLSNINSNLGAYLSFMAVSVGYSWDVSTLIGHKPANHKRFDFNFTCARFTGAIYYYENNDGTNIHRLGDYNNGKFINYKFPGLNLRTFGLDVYYFFNNKKFSYGAVHSFSKFQRKSAGSFMAGFSFDNQNINLDFNCLPENMLQYLGHSGERIFRFHYNDFCLSGGYSYNWVLNRHWVFNITAAPAIGVKHSLDLPMSGHTDTVSMNIKGRGGLIYNVRNFFFAALAKFDGYWYIDSKYSFFNAISTLSVNAGIRF